MAEEKVRPIFSSYEDDLFEGVLSNQKGEDPIEGEWIRLKKKIPRGIFDQMCEVYSYCQVVHDSEGFSLLRIPQGQYTVGVPKQWVGPAHVCAHPELEPGVYHSAVGDGHGHLTMGAFHSGTDYTDEHKHRHGLFMVFATTRSGYTILSTTVNTKAYVRGKVFDLDPMDVFDLDDRSAVPPLQENWKSQIVKNECPHCPKFEYKGWFGGIYGEYKEDENPSRLSKLRDWFFNRGGKKKPKGPRRDDIVGFDPDHWRHE